MGFTVTNLQEYIQNQGFTITAFYRAKKYCAYIELTSCLGDSILVSIPRTYKIKLGKRTGYSIYPLDIDDINATQDSNSYDQIDVLDMPIFDKESNITKILEDSYKDEICINKVDKQTLEKIFNQVNRIKYCFKKLRYKVAVKTQNYMCILERDKSLDLYLIKKFEGNKCMKLFTVVDLELFYEKIENNTIYTDLNAVHTCLYAILDKIQIKHLQSLDKISPNEEIKNSMIKIIDQKRKNNNYITQFYELGKANITNREKTENELEEIRKDINVYRDDNQRIGLTNKLETIKKDQLKIKSARKELIDKTDHLYLISDMAIYNNVVLLDDIKKSVNMLKEI